MEAINKDYKIKGESEENRFSSSPFAVAREGNLKNKKQQKLLLKTLITRAAAKGKEENLSSSPRGDII
ncbi:MAG: hypothetical protein NT012_03340 [Candidatus Nealsonbacteria bacterium]|nr:hypothetical protein [Candidatus Nealsonbacteria bacterium]